MTPQQPIPSDDERRGSIARLPHPAHQRQRFARLGMSLLLVAALFARAALGHMPTAYAASGFNVSNISGNTSEGGGTATFTVVLTGQPTADVTVGLSSNDTTEGTVSPASLTFSSANWNTPQTVTVTGVNDNVDDGDIAYTIITGAASSTDPGYSGQNAADVAVVNQDDDTAGFTVSTISGNTTEAGGIATFTVKLNSQPTANVLIPLISSDTTEGTIDTNMLTFTAANWNTPQTVSVTGVNDDVDDGDITYSIITSAASSADSSYNNRAVANVSALNTDDDTAGITVSGISGNTSEAGGNATFTVVLNSQPTANVTIGLSSNDTTEGTVSPSALTFTAANWSTPQTVTAAGINDDVDDGDINYAIVIAAATSADAKYNGIDAADQNLANIDDDGAGIIVSTISGNTSEAGGTASFSVKLASQPTADVTIGLSSSDTTEGTVGPAALTFTAANWNVPQTATVTGVNDNVNDNNVAYMIVTAPAASADPAYNLLKAGDVSLSNTDDDTAGISVSTISGPTTEAGGTATFTVVLDSQPTANVSISLSSDTTEGTVSPSTLTFTSANWNIAQTVTVTGVDDAAIDGNITYSVITGAAISLDPLYNGRQAADVTVLNLDNDQASAGNLLIYLALIRR